MAGINSLKGLRNVNLSSINETTKKTAALTLLLSMTACTFEQRMQLNDFGLWLLCICPFAPVLLSGMFALFTKKIPRPHMVDNWSDRNENGYDNIHGH